MSNSTLHDALRGVPPPDWTRRPNAKDDRHAQARELRTKGLSYNEIAARLGVSKSSVSLWVRDLPRHPRLSYEENGGALPRAHADTGRMSGKSGQPSVQTK